MPCKGPTGPIMGTRTRSNSWEAACVVAPARGRSWGGRQDAPEGWSARSRRTFASNVWMALDFGRSIACSHWNERHFCFRYASCSRRKWLRLLQQICPAARTPPRPALSRAAAGASHAGRKTHLRHTPRLANCLRATRPAPAADASSAARRGQPQCERIGTPLVQRGQSGKGACETVY